jgi:ADP-ribose pyrophosphatase
MEFKTIQSEIIYRGRVFNVRKDLVELPGGKTTYLDIVEHYGAVTLIPVDEEGYIWFVRQYRHPAGIEMIELPAGVMEPGESPEECAHREVREETGMAADEIHQVGEFYLAPGYSTEFMHVFLATGLHPAPLPGDIDEILSVERISKKEVYAMAEAGHFHDSKTLAALCLARPHLV